MIIIQRNSGKPFLFSLQPMFNWNVISHAIEVGNGIGLFVYLERKNKGEHSGEEKKR